MLPPLVDQAAALNAALATLGQQLKPLQDNVIDVVLNKQTKASPDQIEVTALDLTPAAGRPAVRRDGVQPEDRHVGLRAERQGRRAPEPTPTPIAQGPATRKPPVPTAVPAGPGHRRPTAPTGAGRGPGGGPRPRRAWSWLGAGAAGALGHRVAARRR